MTKIFGVDVRPVTTAPTAGHVVTLNPEMLLHARRSTVYRALLNDPSVVHVVDGFGLQAVLRVLYGVRTVRMTGADLLVETFIRAAAQKQAVRCVLSAEGLTQWQVLQKKLAAQYPALMATGEMRVPEDPEKERGYTEEVVICGFGAPLQELFLAAQKNAILRIGVGGAFDFMSGVLPRAPRWMQICGCEWLYRLVQQPGRTPRIVRAVLVFPVLALWDKVTP